MIELWIQDPTEYVGGRAQGDLLLPHPFNSVIVFDIETLPVVSLLPPDWPDGKFPNRPIWNQVSCISILTADIERDPDRDFESYIVTSCRSGGEESWDERRLLQGFWQCLRSKPAQLISYNGRSYDVPVLFSRSMAHSLTADVLFQSGWKWDSYLSRYSDWHIDMLDQMSLFGACTKVSLGDLARGLGLPAKAGHGSEVADMDIRERRNYGDADVLLTFLVYLRWALVSGRVHLDGYKASLRSLISYLESERASRPHLGRFLDEWQVTSPALFEEL